MPELKPKLMTEVQKAQLMELLSVAKSEKGVAELHHALRCHLMATDPGDVVERKYWEQAIRERDSARQEVLAAHSVDYWAWQDDGGNQLESMGEGMVVQMTAGNLRAMLKKAESSDEEAWWKLREPDPDCNPDDMFYEVPKGISMLIATFCSKQQTGSCTCNRLVAIWRGDAKT